MTHDLLLWLHFMAFALGAAAGFGNAVVGAAIARGGKDSLPVLMPVGRGLGRLGHVGLALLILSGGALVEVGPGWSGVGLWFWVKMALVATLTASIVLATRAARQAAGGDDGALARLGLLGKLNILLVALIVLTAVFEFG